MITVIHGEDVAASRNYYFMLKKNSVEPQTLDGANLTLTDLHQVLSGSDLFGDTKDIYIENLVSKRKGSKDVLPLVQAIAASDQSIYVWESKELTKKQLESFGKASAKLFKIPSTIFALLDALRPGNGTVLVKLFHETLQDKDPEFVLVMLQRHVRILLAMQEASEQTISEVSRQAPWQRGKLEKQAKLFDTRQLIDFHSKLFQLELGMKTGDLSLSLGSEIDMLLLSL